MNISRLKIKGLFHLFTYDIPLNKNDELTIITGPNGFGKTMILNIYYIVYLIADFSFFQTISFF
jgi:predicted ATP-binding protein involved in virulence